MGITHIIYIFGKLVRKPAVVEILVLVPFRQIFLPAAEMHFVNSHRLFKKVFALSFLSPSPVAPFVSFQICDN